MGTVADCCCDGWGYAEGSCCEWNYCPVGDNACVNCFYDGTGASCQYKTSDGVNLELVSTPGDCPATAFDCSTIVCPDAPTPTEPAPTPTEPAPTPTAPAPTPTGNPQPAPPSDSSCVNVPNFGAVESDAKCEEACKTFGLDCVVSGSSSSCAHDFRNTITNGRTTTSTSCICGPPSSETQICQDTSMDSPTPGPTTPGPTKSSAPKHSVFLGVGVLAAITVWM